MNIVKIALLLLLIVTTLPSICASHFIIGNVDNAEDGTSPNGMKIFLWKSAQKYKDRLVEVVGPESDAGVDNLYMFDCHQLKDPCQTGDKLKIKVFGKEQYKTKTLSVIVSENGYDILEDTILKKANQRRICRRRNRFLK